MLTLGNGYCEFRNFHPHHAAPTRVHTERGGRGAESRQQFFLFRRSARQRKVFEHGGNLLLHFLAEALVFSQLDGKNPYHFVRLVF